ncbi:MAG: YidC/Oxa1 family membrane protein insertase, partial [Clostridia bacterium]|nr:YidC/Oxa1 family membrane protein insertase [Clostridia bacterium]
MNKTRRITKVLTLLAILALLIATLASCGGKKQVQKLTVGNVTLQTEKVEGETVILNSLDANELTNIADMLAAAFSEDFDSREMLVAAKRGYDMTDPNFSEEGEFPDQGVNLEAALNVIKAANEKVKGTSDEIPVLPESINEADLQTLIDAFKTKVELEEEGKLLDNLLRGIGGFLNWLTKNLCFGSYLAGICLFAVIVEIVMLPFAIKQQKNTIKQAMLRPKEMAIRNKYKGRTDQVTLQKMQQEIQEFYQKENYSPYSGCLPLLIQMPIILALYQIIIDPLHYVLGQATQLSSALSQYYSASAAAGGLGGAISGNGTIALLSDIGSNAGVVEGLKSFEYFTNSQSVYEALTVSYITMLLTLPSCAFIAFSYPMYLASGFAYEKDSAMIGEASLGEYADASVVSFDDKEVFPARGVRVRNVKVYGENRIDHVIYAAASVFHVVGGPLADVFETATGELGYAENVKLTRLDRDGIESRVDGGTVLIGRAAFVNRYGYSVSLSESEK